MLLAAWLVASALAVAEAVDARPAEAEPVIRAEGGGVTIRASNLPLSQILDRLSSATGMDLTYEGARPTAPVTMSVDGISEAEAVLRLMEGLGVSYVFRTDATGQRVDLLIVSGVGAGTVAKAQSSSAAEPPYEEPVGDYGHIPLDPAAVEAAGPQVKPDLNNPYLGLPAQHFPQGVPAPPGEPPGATAPGGSRNAPQYPNPPSFPQGGSYPTR
jgi:hypothetical protein